MKRKSPLKRKKPMHRSGALKPMSQKRKLESIAYYLDVSTWAALCRRCHDWCHTHPAEAEAIGLLHPDRFNTQ